MALRCRLGRNQCNTKKFGFLGSHMRHHGIPSWPFSSTTATTLPAEGSPDEHRRRSIHTSIINGCSAVDSTKTTATTLPEHCVETLGSGLGNLGDAETNPRVKALGQFAAFTIGGVQHLKLVFERVVSAKVQLVKNGRFYYITLEASNKGVKKLYKAHVLDTLIESNSVSLKDWCELESQHS
ncbi:cystatin-1-like [Cornus florida]|uniref:cystatin-1-like n=1 Tax=Cornus florida TaxID=4283 RepID=UPI002898902A|nr:cystatin-1-like [Cornus florida]